MNNDLYQWHAGKTVRYEMQEIDRAVEQARLLREAGLAGPGWLTRIVNRLGHMLNAPRKGLPEGRSPDSKVLRKKSPRSA